MAMASLIHPESVAVRGARRCAEVATWYGTTALKVNGKGFARLRTEAEGGLVLMCSLEEKEQLLESGEPAYYTTPHYDGYGAIIVNLAKVERDALRDLMMQSWRMEAPSRLRSVFDAARGAMPSPVQERKRRPVRAHPRKSSPS